MAGSANRKQGPLNLIVFDRRTWAVLARSLLVLVNCSSERNGVKTLDNLSPIVTNYSLTPFPHSYLHWAAPSIVWETRNCSRKLVRASGNEF